MANYKGYLKDKNNNNLYVSNRPQFIVTTIDSGVNSTQEHLTLSLTSYWNTSTDYFTISNGKIQIKKDMIVEITGQTFIEDVNQDSVSYIMFLVQVKRNGRQIYGSDSIFSGSIYFDTAYCTPLICDLQAGDEISVQINCPNAGKAYTVRGGVGSTRIVVKEIRN